nr:MAG TPA: hypothetical protein [Caudoviricetes sp.]
MEVYYICVRYIVDTERTHNVLKELLYKCVISAFIIIIIMIYSSIG